MQKQPNSGMCFVCGIENHISLHPHLYTDDEGRCITRFPVPGRHRAGQPGPEHPGYPGQLHGGIISTLLGEPTQTSVLPCVLVV